VWRPSSSRGSTGAMRRLPRPAWLRSDPLRPDPNGIGRGAAASSAASSTPTVPPPTTTTDEAPCRVTFAAASSRSRAATSPVLDCAALIGAS
jgi:hypothetical protein